MTALPSALPPGLYEAASRRGQPIPRQVSGSHAPPRLNTAGPPRTASPLTRPFVTAQPVSAQTTGQPIGQNWLVSPAEKAKYDQFFDRIDTGRTGFIDGEQAVGFFNDSRLPEDALAAIWDLADIKSEGRLSRDEFAVAMYLIRQQRSGAPLPAFLPAALVPPSMRGPQQGPQAQPHSTAPAFQQQPPQLPKSAADDLFGLDEPIKPAPAQAVQTTGGSVAARSPFDSDPFNDKAAAFTPQSTGPTQQSSVFKPFQPTSAFGASIATQDTGGSGSAPQQQNRGFQSPRPPPSAADDLLGDHDEEQSKKLTEETTELANMSTQVGNLRTQMQDVQSKRSTNEREVASSNSQKQELQQRLAQFRAQYEQEVAAVKSLEQQLNTSKTETKKLQQDLAMIEGTHHDLQTQHTQISQALEADRTENANLKSRISELNAQIAELRPQIEKMKSEARQQKGLVAVNKKQLATNEGEHTRLNGELSDLKTEELERSRSAAASPPSVASPTASVHTNPFYRNMTPSGVPDEVQSPTGFLATAPSPSAFDALFGPAASRSTSQGGNPQPSTSFQNTTSDSSPISPKPSVRTSPEIGRNLSPTRNEPPPPPESRQFTPRMLPVHTGGSLAGSATSSTRVAPSAAGGIDGINTPRPEGPGDISRSFGSPPPFLGALAATSAIPAAELDQSRSGGPPSVNSLVHDNVPGAFPGDGSPEKRSTPPPESTAAAPQHSDFDSAFDGLEQSAEHNGTGPEAAASKEGAAKAGEDFYPMTEPAEESDSSDDEDEHGTSNKAVAPETHANGTAANHSGANEVAAPPTLPPIDTAAAAPPPPITQQFSPPAYSPRENTQSDFPDEFHGLLPAREDPTLESHLHSRPSDPHPEPVSAWDQIAAQPSSAAGAAGAGPSTHASAVAFPEDDFDDFNDLAEAKAHSGEADFDFHEEGDSEFNPNFDSPAASMTTAGFAHSTQATPTASNGAHGFSRNADFGSSFPAATAPPAAQEHDWAAIFSGLDTGAPAAAAPKATTAQQPPAQLARGLSTSSAHDDPILQRLVGMGYPRAKALGALEMYDYDIDKVCM